jgi:hypothetical protein
MQIKGVYPSTFGSQGTDEDTLEHKHTEKWKCESNTN